MRRVLIVIVIVIVVLLVVQQLLIPRLAEQQLAGHLVRNGGTATVELSALPAFRMFFGSGDRLYVQGSGMEIDPDQEGGVVSRLDGFSEVMVDLSDLTVGPFEVSEFTLKRGSGDMPYSLHLAATGSPRDASTFAADQIQGPLGALAGAGTLLPDVGVVPIEVNGLIESEDGRLRLVQGGGSIAGVPAGPVIELITAAIVAQIGP
jgi:hypothetical protein